MSKYWVVINILKLCQINYSFFFLLDNKLITIWFQRKEMQGSTLKIKSSNFVKKKEKKKRLKVQTPN